MIYALEVGNVYRNRVGAYEVLHLAKTGHAHIRYCHNNEEVNCDHEGLVRIFNNQIMEEQTARLNAAAREKEKKISDKQEARWAKEDRIEALRLQGIDQFIEALRSVTCHMYVHCWEPGMDRFFSEYLRTTGIELQNNSDGVQLRVDDSDPRFENLVSLKVLFPYTVTPPDGYNATDSGQWTVSCNELCRRLISAGFRIGTNNPKGGTQ